MINNKQIALLLLMGFGVLSTMLFAQREIPPIPKNQTAVYDEAKLLSIAEAKNLERKLINYADTTSTQIVVATIESLQGEDIGIYSVNWAHEWGIGQSKEDNGIFILVAKNDRKIWITPGYGVEIKLTAGINGTIIRNIITPEFKNGNFYTGLDKGTTAIFEVLNGTFEGSRQESHGNGIPIGQLIFLVFIFIIILIAISKNNRGGGHGGRRSGAENLLDVIILSNMGRGGFDSGSFGGGSSGGGFGGGFGGGGFSGGGAGGSW